MEDNYIPWWVPSDHPSRTGIAPEPEPEAPVADVEPEPVAAEPAAEPEAPASPLLGVPADASETV